MVQLQHLEDIADLDTKSLDEVKEESNANWNYDFYSQVENNLVETGIAPSLPAYLLYEHQFNDGTIEHLGDELGIKRGTLFRLMKKLNIPIKSLAEATSTPSSRQQKKESLSVGPEKLRASLREKGIIEQERDYLNRMYHGEGLGLESLANETGVSIPTLRNIMVELGIRIKNSGEANKGRSQTKETKDKISESRLRLGRERLSQLAFNAGMAAGNSSRKRIYVLNGHAYSSIGEAATAQMLESYIPGFQIIEGETFQSELFDFTLPNGDILEWHPTVIKFEASKEDRQTYLEMLKGLPPKEKPGFKRWYEETLALDYWLKRQEKADNSPLHNGAKVHLARDFNELYDDVLAKFGADVPTRDLARTEFEAFGKKAVRVEPSELETVAGEAA